MKDHVDLNSQIKKGSGRDFKEIGGGFWSAASVFSKKLQKWRQNQELKKRGNDGGSVRWPVEKPNGRQYREAQSEFADYGFGRRSFDATARMSSDNDPRHSFDEPRASWDGYLMGKTFPRMPTMVSVLEDSSSSRSLDRSSSMRKTAAAMVAEMKLVSNSKVSPATVDYLYGPKLNSLRDDYSKKSRRWRRHGDVRRNTSVSWRKKKMDEFVPRYSLDNGLSRFYLTPMRSSQRGGTGKSRATIARSFLRLY
ncbi:hypothetical protein V6N12_027159 [Hibiscus sabdariffa]|uniref:Uncharacterized protein n=1 Tax=Hibiscus sabdariffa TaxID=183260 RepID=A0ABR2DTW7_9ROSI